MALVRTQPEIYEPTFDGERGIYVDVCPFKPHSRGNPPYECRCKLDGRSFKTKSQFEAHSKTQHHQNFLGSYERYYKDSDNYRKELKALHIQNGMLDKRVRELHHKLTLSQKILREERDLVKYLREKIQDYENREIAHSLVSDDEFQDCE